MHAPITPPDADEAEPECILSVPTLRAAREAHVAPWRAFQDSVKSLADAATLTLIARIETTTDPLILWEIHLELERRDIPPAFRHPQNRDTDQMHYVTWLADLHWYTRRGKNDPHFRAWRRLFGTADDSWHLTAKNVFEFGWKRGRNASYYAKGLALTDRDRLDLMTIKTTRQIARQRQLTQAAEMRHAIASHAAANAGRFRKDRPPEQATRERYLIWKTYMLADRSETLTANMFTAIYGKQMTRRMVQRQIDAVEQAWNEFGPQKTSGIHAS